MPKNAHTRQIQHFSYVQIKKKKEKKNIDLSTLLVFRPKGHTFFFFFFRPNNPANASNGFVGKNGSADVKGSQLAKMKKMWPCKCRAYTIQKFNNLNNMPMMPVNYYLCWKWKRGRNRYYLGLKIHLHTRQYHLCTYTDIESFEICQSLIITSLEELGW